METVTLFTDYKEEGWESMQLYAGELARNLQKMGVPTVPYVALPAVSALFPSKFARYFFRYVTNFLLAPFHQADVNHVTDQANAHLLVFLNPQKTVVTVHDLIVPFWTDRQEKQKSLKKRVAHAVRYWRIGQLRRAASLIAVSHATKRDIIKYLGVPEEKITVIPEGVDKNFHTVKNSKILRRIVARYNLPKKFILHVGTTATYKNIDGALTLFAALAKKDADLSFVKVGAPWTPKQRSHMKRLGVEPRILHLGFIPQADLPAIYTLALALVQLSHIEGFGFPILEAMRCGCPVIASPIAAHKELLQNNALYVTPKAAGSQVKKILGFLRNSAQATRRAKKRASTYTWTQTALQTKRLYTSL